MPVVEGDGLEGLQTQRGGGSSVVLDLRTRFLHTQPSSRLLLQLGFALSVRYLYTGCDTVNLL